MPNDPNLIWTFKDGTEVKAPISADFNAIKSHLAGNGFSQDEIDEAFSHPRTASFLDNPSFKKFVSGPAKTVSAALASAPGEIADSLNPVAKTGLDPQELTAKGLTEQPSNSWNAPIEDKLYQPKNQFEDYLSRGVKGAVGAVAAPGQAVAKTLAYGVAPALAGKAAGDVAGAAGAGPKTQSAVDMLTSLFSPFGFRKAITKNTVTNPDKLRANQVIEKELPGVQTAGQYASDKTQMLNEVTADPNLNEKQQAEFMKRVTKPTGETSTDVTAGHEGSFIDRNLTRTSNKIEELANTTHIDPNVRGGGVTQPQVYNDLVNLAKSVEKNHPTYKDSVLDLIKGVNEGKTPLGGARAPIPGEEYHNALFGAAPNGGGSRIVDGQDYSRLRSKLHSEAADSKDPSYANHLRNVADVLDNAMENTIANKPSKTGPSIGNWQSARSQYKNMLIMEDARAASGKDRFTPDQLASSVQNIQGRRPYLRGKTDYGWNEDYKKAVPPFPDASATPKPLIPPLLKHAGSVAAGGLEMYGQHLGLPVAGDPTRAIAAMMASEHMANALNRRSILSPMNPIEQARGKNQLLPATGNAFNPLKAAGNSGARYNSALIQALMAAQQPR